MGIYKPGGLFSDDFEFEVYEEQSSYPIGKLKVKEVEYNSTRCKVIEGGSTIYSKFNSGKK